MKIRGIDTETGIKVKIIPFSPESLASNSSENEFHDVLSYRMQTFFRTQEHVELEEKFKSLSNAILEKAPECKELINDIHDDVIVRKEIDCFDEGYRAGMADLMTALTFNDLQITHTGIVDFESMNIKKSVSEGGK